MSNTLAQYAHLKQDILGDGIKEGKLEAFGKLFSELTKVPSIFEGFTSQPDFLLRLQNSGSKILSADTVKELYETVKRQDSNPVTPNALFEMAGELPDNVRDLSNLAVIPLIEHFYVNIVSQSEKTILPDVFLTIWILYAIRFISQIRENTSLPEALRSAARNLYMYLTAAIGMTHTYYMTIDTDTKSIDTSFYEFSSGIIAAEVTTECELTMYYSSPMPDVDDFWTLPVGSYIIDTGYYYVYNAVTGEEVPRYQKSS